MQWSNWSDITVNESNICAFTFERRLASAPFQFSIGSRINTGIFRVVFVW